MERCPAFWHLRDFYILMKKSQKSADAPAVPEEQTEAQENTAQITASA
jgi:hypothetical protein